jgi:hypothetical protein
MPDVPIEREEISDKANTIQVAMYESDIDGHGDEGRGFDYEYFAAALERLGWTYNGS